MYVINSSRHETPKSGQGGQKFCGSVKRAWNCLQSKQAAAVNIILSKSLLSAGPTFCLQWNLKSQLNFISIFLCVLVCHSKCAILQHSS